MKTVRHFTVPILLALLLVFSVAFPAFADYSISVDGEKLDCNVVIVDGRSMIPMRAVGNALGLRVDWVSDTQTAILRSDESTMKFGVSDGAYEADIRHADNRYTVRKQNCVSDLKAKNINGSNYVPVRLICDTFGSPVTVNGNDISIGKIFTATDASVQKVEKFVRDKSLSSTTTPNAGFQVYFLDVGEADAALIQCDGKNMVIDGGNVGDSSYIYSFLQKHNVKHIDIMVATHAHEDHVGGLAGALNYATVGKVYCSTENFDSKAFGDFKKYVEKQNVEITVPKAGDVFTLGSARATVLGPIKATTDENNRSLIIRVEYGNTAFLFAGDAETEEEQDVLASGRNLESTVLKVAHHGSESSTGYLWLRTINPQYAVISVGENNYGHPTEKVLSRLRDADIMTYRTDLQGTIHCVSDGKTVRFSVEKNANIDTLTLTGATNNSHAVSNSPQTGAGSSGNTNLSVISANNATRSMTSAGMEYVLNTNTHKFHYKNCTSVGQMSEKNKLFYTGTREEILAKGYDPCGRCNP